MLLRSEINGGNIRLRMTLKINVGCLSLASEMNGGNIRLRMTLKINVGCLSLASEMNGGNIRLRMTLKINVGCLSQKRTFRFLGLKKLQKRDSSVKNGTVGKSDFNMIAKIFQLDQNCKNYN